jgi:hypothetical protein
MDTIKEDGREGTVTESYLVDALSYAEAESRITEELGDINREAGRTTSLTIKDISPYRLSEIALDDDFDRYYRVKVQIATLDERSGCVKKTSMWMLAGASTPAKAIEVIKESMKGSLCDYEILSVSETNIVDVYLHREKETTV